MNLNDDQKEKFLNSPEMILKIIKRKQKDILEIKKTIDQLKNELTQHFEEGTVARKFSYEGITASYQSRPKFNYSMELTKSINLIEYQKRNEENNGVAKLDDKCTKSWTIR